jgi:hypothetical protein
MALPFPLLEWFGIAKSPLTVESHWRIGVRYWGLYIFLPWNQEWYHRGRVSDVLTTRPGFDVCTTGLAKVRRVKKGRVNTNDVQRGGSRSIVLIQRRTKGSRRQVIATTNMSASGIGGVYHGRMNSMRQQYLRGTLHGSNTTCCRC